MRIVARHLKQSGKVPGLRRLRVWTDGHTSTYKGFPNFGRMGYWPLHKPDGHVGCQVSTLTLSFDLSKPLGLSLDDDALVKNLEGQAEVLRQSAEGGAVVAARSSGSTGGAEVGGAAR